MAVNHRHITPPAGLDLLHPRSSSSSVSSKKSSRSSRNVSPRSVQTHETTPPQSPEEQRPHKASSSYYSGPQLLPRVRTQDQVLHGSSASSSSSAAHRRAVSMTSTGYPSVYGSDVIYQQYHPQPSSYRRSHSPVGPNMLTPISANPIVSSYNPTPVEYDYETTPIEWNVYQQPQEALKPQHQSRHVSQPNVRPSSQRSSYYESTEDPLAAYYTYPDGSRPVTSYDSGAVPAAYASATTVLQETASLADGETEPDSYSTQKTQQHSLLSKFDLYQYPEDVERLTLMEYLTAPNPSPNLIRRLPESRLDDMHFWWDTRNLRSWQDFNLNTIRSVPGFTRLLEYAMFPGPSLPQPCRGDVHPESIFDLRETHSAWYVTKLNAALEASLGVPTMRIHTSKSTRLSGPKAQPDFHAVYENEAELSILGSGKSRVVGLVKAYEQWNTGMVSEERRRVTYRRELAHLHQHMRDHETRYGFIINEIELVCVRNGTETTPYFGYLELAPPVKLSAHGEGQLTACLALWYLHMLAKSIPLQGQCKWHADIGKPALRTRAKHLPRDEKQPQVQAVERRTAVRNRGWAWPSDPLSRTEKGKQKRTRTKVATTSSS